jgi:NAD(P)-dependent dehydrogenase (short-subunit alcohol dehydrogenase family)
MEGKRIVVTGGAAGIWVRSAVGRSALPDDIAPAVAFLASPGSGWINGANLTVDGGFMAAMATGTASV